MAKAPRLELVKVGPLLLEPFGLKEKELSDDEVDEVRLFVMDLSLSHALEDEKVDEVLRAEQDAALWPSS